MSLEGNLMLILIIVHDTVILLDVLVTMCVMIEFVFDNDSGSCNVVF